MKKYFLIVLLLFMFAPSLHSQWIKQNWPTFEIVRGVNFFNENTGLFAMKTYPSGYYAMYRTTNAGFNWIENYRPIDWIIQTQKIDDTTIYMLGDNNVQYVLYRSFNRGVTWDSLFYPVILGFYFISKDTGWAVMSDNDHVRYYKTENGGITFSLLYSQFSSDYEVRLFFLKEKYNGNYIGYHSEDASVMKTTDGGYNWINLPALPIVPQYGKNGKLLMRFDVNQIFFFNKDTGWVANGSTGIFKTTNGGNNWIVQRLLSNSIFTTYADNFSTFSMDTIYLSGGDKYYGGTQLYGIVYKTTNGGLNWGYQQPDTIVNPLWGFFRPCFINSNTGWFSGIHTTNGGGPIIYTEIKNISVEHPEEYQLMQNYPNPFNPSTTIDFYLPHKASVELKIFDISGKTVLRIIDNFQLQQGYHSYKVDDFNSLGLSSGIYFYRLTASDNSSKTSFTETKRLVYLK